MRHWMFTALEDYDLDLAELLDPGLLVEHLKGYNTDIWEHYHDTVSGMCVISTMWAARRILAEQPHNVQRIEIVDGSWNEAGHTWMILDGQYHLDLTLQQFDPNVPKVALIEIDSEEHFYTAHSREEIENYFLDREYVDYDIAQYQVDLMSKAINGG